MRARVLFIAIAASLLITTTAGAAVPAATTGPADNITQTTAKLHGSVKPNKQDTTWHFEIGTSNAYGTNTAESAPVRAGAGNTNVSADVPNLAPGTLYHYRLVATNASGSVPGKDKTFATRSAVLLNASKTVAPFNESVTLAGQVFGFGVILVHVIEFPTFRVELAQFPAQYNHADEYND